MCHDRIVRLDSEWAHAFTAGVCTDPKCGLHLVPMRHGGEPICEMVIGRAQLRGLVAYIQQHGLDLP